MKLNSDTTLYLNRINNNVQIRISYNYWLIIAAIKHSSIYVMNKSIESQWTILFMPNILNKEKHVFFAI